LLSNDISMNELASPDCATIFATMKAR